MIGFAFFKIHAPETFVSDAALAGLTGCGTGIQVKANVLRIVQQRRIFGGAAVDGGAYCLPTIVILRLFK